MDVPGNPPEILNQAPSPTGEINTRPLTTAGLTDLIAEHHNITEDRLIALRDQVLNRGDVQNLEQMTTSDAHTALDMIIEGVHDLTEEIYGPESADLAMRHVSEMDPSILELIVLAEGAGDLDGTTASTTAAFTEDNPATQFVMSQLAVQMGPNSPFATMFSQSYAQLTAGPNGQKKNDFASTIQTLTSFDAIKASMLDFIRTNCPDIIKTTSTKILDAPTPERKVDEYLEYKEKLFERFRQDPKFDHLDDDQLKDFIDEIADEELIDGMTAKLMQDNPGMSEADARAQATAELQAIHEFIQENPEAGIGYTQQYLEDKYGVQFSSAYEGLTSELEQEETQLENLQHLKSLVSSANISIDDLKSSEYAHLLKFLPVEAQLALAGGDHLLDASDDMLTNQIALKEARIEELQATINEMVATGNLPEDFIQMARDDLSEIEAELNALYEQREQAQENVDRAEETVAEDPYASHVLAWRKGQQQDLEDEIASKEAELEAEKSGRTADAGTETETDIEKPDDFTFEGPATEAELSAVAYMRNELGNYIDQLKASGVTQATFEDVCAYLGMDPEETNDFMHEVVTQIFEYEGMKLEDAYTPDGYETAEPDQKAEVVAPTAPVPENKDYAYTNTAGPGFG